MNDDLKQEHCDFEIDAEQAFALSMLIVMRLRDVIVEGEPKCPIPDEAVDIVGGALQLACEQIMEVAQSWGAADGILSKMEDT